MINPWDWPKKIVYAVYVVIALVLIYFGSTIWEKWQDHNSDTAHQQAEQHHASGQNNANQGHASEQGASVFEQKAKDLQAQLDASDAAVAKLKKRLADAQHNASNHGQSSDNPVVDGGNPPVDPAGVVDALKDEIIVEQSKEIDGLKDQNADFKKAMEGFKASSGFYKAAYEDECKARAFDKIAHEAALSAAKAGKLKVGIVSFGSGVALGAVGKSLMSR